MMGLELDWLEREERYRRRVVRLMGIGLVLVATVAITFVVTRGRAEKSIKAAAAQAAEKERLAAIQRKRDAFVADSSATANRYATFLRTYNATAIENSPLLQIPLPAGMGIVPFVQKLWPEYAHVVDPQLSADQEREWYRQYYIDVMNEGPLRPRAVLLPALEQQSTKLVFRKATFTDITLGQVTVGMREAPQEVLPDSTLAAPVPSETPSETPAATPPPTPAPAPAPAPAEPAPADTQPAPPDTTPKP